jgi:hypothetical protein
MMRNRRSKAVVLAVAAACIALPAYAQPTPQSKRIPTVTRLVKIFSQLEGELYTKAADSAALERMLDPAFEMRDGAAPGEPIPRDEWIRRSRSAGWTPRIDQMAVHDFGDVAIVSFRQVETGRTRHERFIVDCWKRTGDGWQLAVRYASAGDQGANAPGEKKRTPAGTIDKRY